MLPYIAINLLISAFAFKDILAPKYLDKFLSIIILIVLSLFIGLRFRVGGDWGSYELIYLEVSSRNLSSIFDTNDKFFYLLNYFVSLLNLKKGFILINLLISIFIFVSFYKFITFNNLNLTAFLVFFPFTVIILMGYTRQSVILGFLYLIFSMDVSKNKLKLIIFSVISFFFHFTGILLLLLIFSNIKKIYFQKNYYIKIFLFLILLSILIYYLNLSTDKYISKFFYFMNFFNSPISMVRNFPIFVGCFIFLIFRKYFKFNLLNYNIYLYISFFGVVIYFLTIFLGSIADRLMIFFLPLTIVVFSKLLEYFNSNKSKFIYLISLNITLAFFLFTWLFFSNSGESWLPYNILLERNYFYFNPYTQYD